jgi:hypothetical protein
VPWILLIFLAVFLVIGITAAYLVKNIKERKILDIKNINKAAVYVKFINNFKLAEEMEKKRNFDQALLHYKSALQILTGIPDKDDLVIQNIDSLKLKIKILDNNKKKVHNK